MAIVEADQYGTDVMPLKLVRSLNAVFWIITRCVSTNTVVYFNSVLAEGVQDFLKDRVEEKCFDV